MIDLVLVHAFPLDARMWAPQLHAAPEGLRLHTPELPGFGQAIDREGCDSIDGMAQALRRWVHARGLDRFVLAGVSMGGYVALSYWRQFESDGMVRGLVLADTRAEPDSPEGKRTRDEHIALVGQHGLAPLVDRLLPKLVSAQAPRSLVGELRAIMESQAPESVACALRAMRDRPDSSQMLHSIDVPTLVVGGTGDQITTPDVMQRLAQGVRGAAWEAVPDAGHLASLEQPALFNRALFTFALSCTGCEL